MYGVIIAMMPAMVVSFIVFGMAAVTVTIVAILSCVLFEYLITKFMLNKAPAISDGSAIITGILLAFNLPATLPWWAVVMGSLVAIGVGKMSFGGLGNNPFNPALVGRVFLLISFPVAMTSWPEPYGSFDAKTGATPLGLIKEGFSAHQSLFDLVDKIPSYTELFLGGMGGSIGEISGLALLIGLIFMLIRKVVTWHIPVAVAGSMFIFSGLLWMFSFEGHTIILEHLNINIPFIKYMDTSLNQLVPFHMADPVFHLLAGGALLGAFFMATDYVTSPMTTKGMLIFGTGIGVITIVIRVFGGFPEGMSFAILIMNGFVPLMNKYIKPKRFGNVKNG